MTVRLYRGITVPSAEFEPVCADIRENGIQPSPKATWGFEAIDLRPRLSELLEKKDLSTEDTRPSRWVKTQSGQYRELISGFPVVCACGDELGATYYAVRHNRPKDRDSAILIGFEVEVDARLVDGRDFLYNFVFQMGHSKEQRRLALEMFGSALAPYLDRAWQRQDTSYRVAMCDLAVQDLDIVRAHYSNEIVIGGRYGTVFRSAFFVRLPVPAERILSVASPRSMRFEPEITIERFKTL